MEYAVVDTETTGMDPEQDRIVEIGAVWKSGTFKSSLVNPGRVPIGFGAMAVHHITNDMVAHAPRLRDALRDIGFERTDTDPSTPLLNSDVVIVMHNASFDRPFLPDWMQALPWICTYRCALGLYPDAESHSNGSLWYELGLDHHMPPEAGNAPHRALFDALMTRDLLEHEITTVATQLGLDPDDDDDRYGAALNHLITMSSEPVVLKTCRFGKHRGNEWKYVPSDYMNWVLGQDFDQDVKHTCRYWINRRQEEGKQ